MSDFSVNIDGVFVKSAQLVWNLGVFLDSTLSPHHLALDLSTHCLFLTFPRWNRLWCICTSPKQISIKFPEHLPNVCFADLFISYTHPLPVLQSLKVFKSTEAEQLFMWVKNFSVFHREENKLFVIRRGDTSLLTN